MHRSPLCDFRQPHFGTLRCRERRPVHHIRSSATGRCRACVADTSSVRRPGPAPGWRTALEALIENRRVIPAGFVTQGAGEPIPADASRPAYGQIGMGVDPVAGDEFEEQRAVEAGPMAQLGKAQAGARWPVH